MKKRITFDFETRSAVNLKTAGAYVYSLDPSTQPTCLSFKVHGDKRVYFLPFKSINREWREQPEELKTLWRGFILNGFEFSAQNAFFERSIYENILVKRYHWPLIPADRYRCTAAKAAACALPRNLEGAGEAMKLPIQKDKRGYIAMMLTCKPTKAWNAWAKLQYQVQTGARISAKKKLKALELEPPKFLTEEAAPDVWQTLYTYCKIDVRAEEALDDALPDLPPFEQRVWFLNQKLNWRGLNADIKTVRKIVGLLELDSRTKLKELDSVTMGLVTKPGARQSILDFLAFEGIELPDIKAKTVEDALADTSVTGDMRKLLELRKALSKTSTKKYQAFLNRAASDGRIRDILLYHGASTGRDAGVGVQFQNLPRPLIKQNDIDYILELLQEDLEPNGYKDFNAWVEMLYGNVTMVFSSLLRSMLIPSEGFELFVSDFAKIEVAVCWWMAGNKEGLDILLSGKDPYIYQGRKKYK